MEEKLEMNSIETYKYKIMINNKWFVRFEETGSKKGRGAYTNVAFSGELNAIPDIDNIIVSDNKEDGYLIDGRTNLKSYIDKILNNRQYKFYHLDIYEQGE